MSRLVVLDNEAVRALRDPAHPKHRRVVSHVQVIASRKRRADPIAAVVPTAVRVEAGWDRTSPAWSFLNRLRIADVPLDTAHASAAAAIRERTGVSVADAHLGAVMRSASTAQITVITSDPGDMRRVAGDAGNHHRRYLTNCSVSGHVHRHAPSGRHCAFAMIVPSTSSVIRPSHIFTAMSSRSRYWPYIDGKIAPG